MGSRTPRADNSDRRDRPYTRSVRFAPHTDGDVREMLATVGVPSIDDLFSQIPEDLRLERPLDLPPGVSEQEILADLASLARRDRAGEDLIRIGLDRLAEHVATDQVPDRGLRRVEQPVDRWRRSDHRP